MRPIKLGAMVDGNWIVESGLKAGDKVIVSNLQKIRPGAPVKIANAPTGRKPASRIRPRRPEPAHAERTRDMARFFIDRPIFAWVVSLGILLAGFIALRALPIEQYPEVAPPSLDHQRRLSRRRCRDARSRTSPR